MNSQETNLHNVWKLDHLELYLTNVFYNWAETVKILFPWENIASNLGNHPKLANSNVSN